MARALSSVSTKISTDSILKYCDGGVGRDTFARRGDCVEDLIHFVLSGECNDRNYKLIFIHCGTNNVGNGETFCEVV